MSLKDLTDGDFQYLKNKARNMRSVHEKEFLSVIDPTLMRALYRGRQNKTNPAYGGDKDGEAWNNKAEFMAYSKLFQSANTILPTLYFQNPAPIVTPLRDSDEDSAALMSAIMKHYMKANDAKAQNQEAVLNAYWMGIGWKKPTWRSVYTPQSQNPEDTPKPGALDKIKSGMMSMLGMPQSKPDNLETREMPEYLDYETLVNDSEDPCNVMLDDKADLRNSKAILHRVTRTLHDLKICGYYDPQMVAELYEHMQNKIGLSRFDEREVEVALNELHIMQRNGVWICTWADDFDKPLRYEPSAFEGKGFSFCPLVLTNEPGVRYPISHFKVASQSQIKLNDLLTLWVNMAARSRDILIANQKALGQGGIDALEKNMVKGIIAITEDIRPGMFQELKSSGTTPDLSQLISLISQNLVQITGGDSQLVEGQSKNETLGQDELARTGTKAREAGMRDRVRDWMREQLRKEAVLIKTFSNSQLDVLITGKDYANQVTGETIEDHWRSFMTPQNPLGAKHYLQGEFDFDVDMEEAVVPNRKSQAQSYDELLQIAVNPQLSEMLLPNYRLRADLIMKDRIGTIEGIGNVDRYLEKLDSAQAAAIMTRNALNNNPQLGQPKPIPVPSKKPGANSEQGEATNRSSVEANV